MGVEDHGALDHGHAVGAEETEHADSHLPDHTHDVHGHDDDARDTHGHAGEAIHGRPLPFAPFDSPWKITAPLIVLATLAVGAGYLNAPALKIYWFEHQTESSIGLPIDHGDEQAEGEEEPHGEEEAVAVTELAAGADGTFVAASEGGGHSYEPSGPFAVPAPPVFTWANAAPGLLMVLLGFLISLGASLAVWGGRKNPFSPFVGLTTKSKPIGAVHRFLVAKLQLDNLYENVIVKAVAYPISQAAYWVNQNVIDGMVDAVGKAGKRSGELVYRYIDQGIVDGIVNTSGRAASEGGHALQPLQSGKVNQYGALLFAAATVGAILLILLNV
jgi:NADH-quinone oxidoreductase subunit L